MSREPITGKVARILNEREVAINRGREDGVTDGMRFAIVDIAGEDIRDPDTNAYLGSLGREKARVAIVEVSDRMSVGRTYETTSIGYGASPFTALSGFSALFLPRQEVVKTLRSGAGTFKPLSEDESAVKVGDLIREIPGTPDATGASASTSTQRDSPETGSDPRSD